MPSHRSTKFRVDYNGCQCHKHTIGFSSSQPHPLLVIGPITPELQKRIGIHVGKETKDVTLDGNKIEGFKVPVVRESRK